MIEKALRANDAQVAIEKILLRKLRPAAKCTFLEVIESRGEC